MSTVVIFVLPFITMKMLSDDKRQKVDQILLTAPVSVTGIIMGKFLAGLAVFAIMFAPTLIFQIIVSFLASANWLEYLYCLFGMLLLGSAMIAIGMFISSLTESSVIAAVLTMVINIVVMMATSFASSFAAKWVTAVAQSISFIDRFGNFTQSVFSVADVVYFISIAVLFVFLSVRSVEKRRWS
jgi:ABC-2 type transport system permease protein